MSDILQKICAVKVEEVAAAEAAVPLVTLRSQAESGLAKFTVVASRVGSDQRRRPFEIFDSREIHAMLGEVAAALFLVPVPHLICIH